MFNLTVDICIQLAIVLESLDQDKKIGCIVLTGSTRAFAGTFPFIFKISFTY